MSIKLLTCCNLFLLVIDLTQIIYKRKGLFLGQGEEWNEQWRRGIINTLF